MSSSTAEHQPLPSSDPSPSASAAVVEIEEAHEESDEEELLEDAEDLPPLGSVLDRWIFWWKVVRWPLAFFICNVVVIGSLYTDRRYNWILHVRKKEDRSKVHEHATFYLTLVVIFVINTALLFRAARFVEKQIAAIEQEGESRAQRRRLFSSELPTTNVYGRVSHLADAYLSRNRGLPAVTLFVNLLFLLSALAATASVMSLGRAVSWASISEPEKCFPNDLGDDDGELSMFEARARASFAPTYTNLTGVPEELQSWAASRRSGATGGELQYSHLQDGSVFFAGIDPDATSLRATILLKSDGTANLESFPQIQYPTNFVDRTVDDDDSASPSTPDRRRRALTMTSSTANAFCFVATLNNAASSASFSPALDDDDELVDDDDDEFAFDDVIGLSMLIDDAMMLSRSSDRVILCYKSKNQTSSSNDDQQSAFLPAALPDAQQGNISGTSVELKADPTSSDLLWIKTSNYDESESITAIYKLDVNAMQSTEVASMSRNQSSQHHHGLFYDHYGEKTPCEKRQGWVDLVVSVIALSLASFWLLRVQGVPSGMSPLALVADILMVQMLGMKTTGIVECLGVVAITVVLMGQRSSSQLLLFKWLSSDVLVWLLYSFLVILPREFYQFRYHFGTITAPKIIPILTWLVVVLALDHKALQVLGWAVGIGSVVYAGLGLCFYPFLHTTQASMKVAQGIIVGCGLVSIGYTLSKYKAYGCWYCKRGLRAIRSVSRRGRGPRNNRGASQAEYSTDLLLQTEGGTPA